MWKTWPQPVSADQPAELPPEDAPPLPFSASSVATSQQTGHWTPWNITIGGGGAKRRE